LVPHLYADAVRRILEHLETTQIDAIDRAADAIVKALRSGGAVFCANIGHNNQDDFLNRAGGLAALQRFAYSLSITDPVAACLADRPRSEPFERDIETVRFAVRASNLRRGDVVLVGSVSGRNREPVELALACRDLGVTVIGMTSLTYTRQVESLHPSGKRLFEVADVVVDNGAPFGDAAVQIPGCDHDLLPVSGVAFIVSGWMIFGRVMEKMAEIGDPATAFISANRPGGMESYQENRDRYNNRGY
jgi:uncharacterized phosphosugar-binding protein